MIPTSEEGRARQEPLLRELDRAARSHAASAAPDDMVMAQARNVVETTLVGLREPASARPYDAERAHGLRRRVLTIVMVAADEVAGVDPRPVPEQLSAVLSAVRSGQLVRDLLADIPSAADT